MSAVQRGPMIGLLAQLLLLAALAATVGLTGPAWVVGLACAGVTSASLATGLARRGQHDLGPADRVTLTRATLVCGVAALTAQSFFRPAPGTTLPTLPRLPTLTALLTLTIVALILDAVDGWVARRTQTVSTLGARFDMEVDAFLILVLSVYVARSAGAWVLAIGAARYGFGAAGWALSWMRGSLPQRYWRKVVAATQGVALTVAAANVLPPVVMQAALVASLALLTESFGRDVGWLWRHRLAQPVLVSLSARLPEPAHRVLGQEGIELCRPSPA